MFPITKVDGIQNTKSSLNLVKFEEREKWDQIVRSFNNFDIFYLTDYLNAFKIHGDGEPLLFYYEDKNFKAMNVVMKRDIALDNRFKREIAPNTFFDSMTPYGFAGFLIEGSITEESLKNLDNEYCILCQEEGIISEFVRFHPVTKNSEDIKDIYEISLLGKTITMQLSSHSQILSNLTSDKRKKIKKAKQLGMKVYRGKNPVLVDEFIREYNLTMNNNGAEDYYYFKKEFFNSILYDLKNESCIFYAVDAEERIVAMAIYLFTNRKINCFLSASDPNLDNLALTNLIMYEVACLGSENGFNTLHMGGGVGGKEDSLYSFKKGFNKNSDTTFLIGKKIFDKEKYEKLVDIRQDKGDFNADTLYFPIYRS